jgi:hypothetical protein
MGAMIKRRLVAVVLAVLLLIAGGAFLGILLATLFARPSPVRVFNPNAVVQQIRTISELSTVKYVIQKVVVMEVPPESLLGQMFAGDNRVLLVAQGIVKAGIDLSQMNARHLDISGTRIRLKLPPPRITDVYLDESQTSVVERTTGLFRSFDKNLEQNARQIAVEDIRRAARANGILKDAEDRARVQIRQLFEPLGYQVEFSDQ